jgi:hypothetical protein
VLFPEFSRLPTLLLAKGIPRYASGFFRKKANSFRSFSSSGEARVATSRAAGARLPLGERYTLAVWSEATKKLVMQQPHSPASKKHSYHGHGKAVSAIADHLIGGIALGDPEDDGKKQREQRRRAKVRELQEQNHCFFPMAMW